MNYDNSAMGVPPDGNPHSHMDELSADCERKLAALASSFDELGALAQQRVLPDDAALYLLLDQSVAALSCRGLTEYWREEAIRMATVAVGELVLNRGVTNQRVRSQVQGIFQEVLNHRLLDGGYFDRLQEQDVRVLGTAVAMLDSD